MNIKLHQNRAKRVQKDPELEKIKVIDTYKYSHKKVWVSQSPDNNWILVRRTLCLDRREPDPTRRIDTPLPFFDKKIRNLFCQNHYSILPIPKPQLIQVHHQVCIKLIYARYCLSSWSKLLLNPQSWEYRIYNCPSFHTLSWMRYIHWSQQHFLCHSCVQDEQIFYITTFDHCVPVNNRSHSSNYFQSLELAL